MTRSTGHDLPEALAGLLAGDDLEARVGDTFLLVTTGEDGWPHVAMLSAGEVLASGPRGLRLALWPGSATTGNLARSGRGLLMALVPPVTYYVRLRCRPAGEVAAQGRKLAAFAADIDEVLEDVVSYAEVLSGIRFRLNDRERTLAGWTEAISALREEQ